MPIFHIYTFVEFIGISGVYYFIFKRNLIYRRLLVALTILFSVLSVISLIYWEGLSRFNTIQRAFEYAILLLYFIMFLSTILRSKAAPLLELHPYFTLTIGFFIYFSGTILLFLNANKFIELDIVNYWFIHGVLNIFLNIIYFVVLWTGTKVAKLL